MALLDDQIEETQAAFVAAHEAGDAKGAQALADHLRGLQAQKAELDTATQESSQAGTNLRNPAVASLGGAAIGAAVNPTRGAIHDIITPPAPPPKMSAPTPQTITPQNPVISSDRTPYNPRRSSVEESVGNWKNYTDAQTEAAKGVRRDTSLLKKYPNMQLGGAGSATVAPTAPPPVPPTMAEKGKNLISGLVADHQPNSPFSIVKGATRGAITGAAMADVPQQIEQGNYGTAAADTGISAGNIIHGLARTPKGKALGTILGLGSGAARTVQGVNELMPEQKADGGAVHLAGGGLTNALTQTAINAPYVAPTAVGIAKNIGKGAYAPAIEDAASLGLSMAPLNPLTAALSLMAPGEAGAGSTIDEWNARKAAEEQARQRAQKQFEHEEFLRNKVGVNAPKLLEQYQTRKMAAGGEVAKKAVHLLSDAFAPVKKSGVQLAREANYAHDLVPTHNFTEPQKLSIQDLQGGVLVGVPGDRSLTGHSLMSVNGVPLSKSVELHGGPRYGQRKSDLGEDAFWASQSGAASALQNKATNAAERAKGNPVFGMYTAMAPDSSNYALHHTEALVNQLDALNPNKAKLRAFDNMIKEKHPDFLGMQHPEVMDQFSANSELRKYVADRLNKSKIAAEYGMPSGEATIHAITDPALRNVATGNTGFSVGEMRPGTSLRPELEHPTYDTQIPGQFKGQMIAQLPWEYYFPEAAKKIAANPNQAPYAWGTFKMGDYHQPVTQELVDKIAPIEEMVKSATQDFKGHAAGGKVGAIKKIAEDLQAAYKSKFTPGFYHGSPSPNIKAFSNEVERNPNFLSPLEQEKEQLGPRGFTSLTTDPKFANDYAEAKRGTVYPVSANLGKHFDPRLPENYALFHKYWKSSPDTFPNAVAPAHSIPKYFREGDWGIMEDPGFIQHLKDNGYNSMTMVENGRANIGVFNPADIRGKFAKFNPEDAADPDFMKAAGGPVEHFQVGGKVIGGLANFIKHPHGQDARVAQALEEYLKGNISQEERIRIMNQYLPMRQWNELPPNYTDEQIKNALMSNKQEKALAPVPAGMRVGNRLDIPAYVQNGVYVDTTHSLTGSKSPISYNRTGHLTDVNFSSKPNQAVRVGLGTKEQALTPMGAEIGSGKSPFALIEGTNVGTSDDEVRRMMTEMMKDPNYTQIGMDPRRHSQFYDKSTGMPVWAAEEKLQSGPLIIAPKKGLETTSWDDPRLNLTDFPSKQYAAGGLVFDPQGADYDYQTALAHGMGPTGTGENQGHWGSVAPVSDDEQQLHDLPSDSYTVLKGKSHPTFYKAEAAENERGSEIVKKGDRYYSVPKK